MDAPPCPRPVCLQFGTERGGKRARAWRFENSAARGRDTRTLFRGVKGKAFWCLGGEHMPFGRDKKRAKIAACIMA